MENLLAGMKHSHSVEKLTYRRRKTKEGGNCVAAPGEIMRGIRVNDSPSRGMKGGNHLFTVSQ